MVTTKGVKLYRWRATKLLKELTLTGLFSANSERVIQPSAETERL
jgi:hypothetical protein